eukprot:2635246-Amphidinium_carterae.1
MVVTQEVLQEFDVPEVHELLTLVPAIEYEDKPREVFRVVQEAKDVVVEVPQVLVHEVLVDVPERQFAELVREVPKPQVQTVPKEVLTAVVELRSRQVEVPCVLKKEE